MRDHTGDQGLQHLTCVERQRGRTVQPGEDSRVILPVFGSTWWRKVKKTKPNSPQWRRRKKRQWAQTEAHAILKYRKLHSKMRFIKQWNRVFRETLKPPSLKMLKTYLNKVPSKLL